jgi:hypothetical protein
MRPKVKALMLTAALAGIGMPTNVPAQAGFRTPPAPMSPPIMDKLMANKDAKLFAKLLRVSGLTRTDFDSGYVTFFVPRDATCTASDRTYLEGLANKDAARAYVLNHAFEGSLTIGRDDSDRYDRVGRVHYFAQEQNIEGWGRVDIDEFHPFNVPLLSGKSVLLSLKNGTVYVGPRSTVLFDDIDPIAGGGVIDLDQCAAY